MNKIRELFRPESLLKLEEKAGDEWETTCLIPFDAVCWRETSRLDSNDVQTKIIREIRTRKT